MELPDLDRFQRPQPHLDADWLARRIRMLFSAYRKDDYADAESFMAQLAMNLQQYPREVVEQVTDPLTGIQTRSKWPPSLAEIIEECRLEQEHRQKVARFSSMGSAAPRLPRPRLSRDSGEQGPAPAGTVFENYEEAFRRHGRPRSPSEVTTAKVQVRPAVRHWQEEPTDAVRARLGISDETWDAIPDA